MTPSDWRSAQRIAAEALEQREEDRASFIARACQTHPELKPQVERLVSAGDADATFPFEYFQPAGAASFLPDGYVLSKRFRILGLLAKGGMGEVYRARDLELREDVALKIINQEIANREGVVERFRHEVRRARRISHPNVCRIHDLYIHSAGEVELRFLTMQLIAGPTLAQVIRGVEKMPIVESISLLTDILEGLDAAHKAGIAHCDLKPNNILIFRSEGQRPSAVITDFGLARALRDDAAFDFTQTGFIGGAPPYMAPEARFASSNKIAGDIFAFGVIAYELLTGTHPFGRKPPWEFPREFRPARPRDLTPEIPPRWDAAVMKCLEFEPADRFASVAELRSSLVEPETAEPPKPPRPFSRRSIAVGGAAAVVAGAAGMLARRWNKEPDVIAVLPFENVSQDASLDYLGDGITESLINSLSQLASLRIPAAGLVRKFKGSQTPTETGGALKAKAVLVGRVRRAGGLLTVDTELIDVASGRQIWGNQYNLAWTNMLDVQESICAGILSGLRIPLGARETNTLKRGLTNDQEAYQLYLRGQYLLGLRTEDSLAKARDSFTQAVNRDPNFALAYTGLASARFLLGYFGVDTPKASMPAARDAAERAVAIEPTVAQAYSVLGFVKAAFDWDWTGAEAGFRKAIQLKEDYAEAHHWYAQAVLRTLGRHNEAIAEMKRAINFDPTALILHTNLGRCLFFARRYEETIDQLQKVIGMNSQFNLPYWTLGQAWAAKGNLAKAVEVTETARRLQPGAKPDLSLAYCYAACGRPEEARSLLGEVLTKYTRPSYAAVEAALVQGALGDFEAGLRNLELSYAEKEPELIDIGADPKFDSFRSQPSFMALLRRLGLDTAVHR